MNKQKGFNRSKASRNLNQDDLEVFQQNTPIIKQQVYSQILVSLDKRIGEVHEYRDSIEAIKDAGAGDEARLIINTCGGNMQTALAFISALNLTEASTVAEIEGEASSAGSLIALHCDNIELNEYSTMFIHAESFGSGGKRNEVQAHVAFSLRWVEGIIRSTYKHFLTESEIDDVLNGKDYYFDATEIAERLERKNKLLLAEQNSQEASEDPNKGYIVPPLEYDPEDVAFNGKEYFVVAEVFDSDKVDILSAPDSFDNSVIIYDDYMESENEAGTIKLFKLVEVLTDVA